MYKLYDNNTLIVLMFEKAVSL